MSIQRALAGLEMYSSMTILPFEGVKGLSLYLKQKVGTRERIFRNLGHCKEFCDVARISFSNPEKAILENVSVYRGMQEVYKNEKIREGLAEKITEITDVINVILQGDNPSRDKVEESIQILNEITKESEKRLDRSDYEKVILGKYTAI